MTRKERWLEDYVPFDMAAFKGLYESYVKAINSFERG